MRRFAHSLPYAAVFHRARIQIEFVLIRLIGTSWDQRCGMEGAGLSIPSKSNFHCNPTPFCKMPQSFAVPGMLSGNNWKWFSFIWRLADCKSAHNRQFYMFSWFLMWDKERTMTLFCSLHCQCVPMFTAAAQGFVFKNETCQVLLEYFFSLATRSWRDQRRQCETVRWVLCCGSAVCLQVWVWHVISVFKSQVDALL